MDTLQFRTKAKIVAIVDLILTALCSWLIFLLFAAALTFAEAAIAGPTADKKGWDKPNPCSDNLPLQVVLALLLWCFFLLLLGIYILELVAGVKLLRSTDEALHPLDAIEKANFWKILAIITTVFTVLNIFISQGYAGAVFLPCRSGPSIDWIVDCAQFH